MKFVELTPRAGPWPAVSSREVPDATLSRVEHGRLNTSGKGKRFIRGAVYDADRSLLVESQKFAPDGYPWIPADSSRLRRGGPDPERLEGSWMYGGHWAQHFGHFAIETLTTLWPERPADLAGLVFHKYLRGPAPVEGYQQRMLDLLGWSGLEIRIVEAAPVSVEHLVVPSRTVVPSAFTFPEARSVWQRVGGHHDGDETEAVYLSRTLFNEKARLSENRAKVRTTAERDRVLDEVFAASGFTVVHPETRPIDEQLSILRSASIIAGLPGTALHMSAFARPSTAIVELGDARSREAGSKMQAAIDSGYGRRHAFVPSSVAPRALARQLTRWRRARG